MRVSRRPAAAWAAAAAVAVAVSLAAPVQALGATSRPPSPAHRVPCADPVVDAPVGGEAAVQALGSDLAEAAAKLHRSPGQYRRLLRSDAAVRVDRCAQTFMVEPAATAAETAAAAVQPLASEPFLAATAAFDNSGDPWALNSRPDSEKTIFLDFDGALVTDTAWNAAPYAVTNRFATGYDADNAPTSFSRSELDVIRDVWLQVAEDYAPFDVNVTTEDRGQDVITRTGPADLMYGTRVLITSDTGLETGVCGSCGGVAYIDKFGATSRHDYYQPALVFQVHSGNTAKGIGEAAAHEAGHTLGLLHDGTATADYYSGHGVWAPIMGSGYGKAVTQWSTGEYPGANNPQDDVAVIANRLGFVGDDHADVPTAATRVIYGGAAVDGLIGKRTDIDWFTFSVPEGSTSTTLQVTPQRVGPDVDLSLAVFQPDGTPLGDVVDPPVAAAGSKTVTGLGAALTVQALPVATYTVRVDGVASPSGTLGYSDYASLGRYTVTLTGEGGDLQAPLEPAPDGTVGVDYSYALPASGGVRPYTWTVDPDSTPLDGFQLSSSGVLTGRPRDPGTFTTTLLVTDKEGRTARRPVTIDVVEAPPHVVTVEQPPAPPDPTTTPVPVPTQTPVPTTDPTPTPTTTPTTPPPVNPGPSRFAGSLRAAVAALAVRAENGAGYAAARFPLVDADHDCRSTRTEVLQADSRRAVSWTSRTKCAVRSGSWLSLLDRRTARSAAQMTAVWTVPLAEAWQSGARGWPAARRQAYANDLGDTRTLLAVTTRSARARADREPSTWLPPAASRCAYVADWVAAKLRWGLTADAREKAALGRIAASCSTRLTVTRT